MIDYVFLQNTIDTCKKEQERLRMDFERQEGVIRFCQHLIQQLNNKSKQENIDATDEVNLNGSIL